MTATRPQTYDAVARALHWLTVLGFIGTLHHYRWDHL